MAKGKEAISAANRRVQAAHEVIDRLTDELAQQKVLRREAERRLARVEHQAARVEELERQQAGDELLADALAALDQWRTVAREDQLRRNAALKEVASRLMPDLALLSPSEHLGSIDRYELLLRRYPRIIDALSGGHSPRDDGSFMPKDVPRSLRKPKGEDLRRVQQLLGLRAIPEWAPDADMADVVNDLLDAKHAAFTKSEISELLGIDA
jgi:hypothetical protein